MSKKGVFYLQGGMSEELFNVLIELSSINSERVINALRAHLVYGHKRKVACESYNVNPGYLSVCIGRLSRIHYLVDTLTHLITD
ncbi:PapB/FocB family fimbrial expression transcriptional regulator [Escherichia coli]|uniref:PapB/FocB family fimbrial expression transcriptional regulator n=1 Tax=Escherichia coli TaxID=562 RepID=UPI0023799486|nr:PapB/FocB family fimbrial expression transcriptional regulator [Escherichia coli]